VGRKGSRQDSDVFAGGGVCAGKPVLNQKRGRSDTVGEKKAPDSARNQKLRLLGKTFKAFYKEKGSCGSKKTVTPGRRDTNKFREGGLPLLTGMVWGC